MPIFSNIFAEDTIGNSNYNSMQAMVEKRFSKGLQFQLAYTWSKSFDYGSSFEGELNPINPALSFALSLFDARNRFVASYVWDLPVPEYKGAKGKMLDGWEVSGITTFQCGFPIRMYSSADNELLTSSFFEPVGAPQQLAPFQALTPQKNGNYYFNPANFTKTQHNTNTIARRLWQHSAHRLLRPRHQQLGLHDSEEHESRGTVEYPIPCRVL